VSTPAELLGETIAPHALGLAVNGVELEATTNDPEVWEGLRRYYAPWVTSVSLPAVRVRLIQGQVAPRGRLSPPRRGFGLQCNAPSNSRPKDGKEPCKPRFFVDK
jgi:hypothetical protein